MADTSKPITGTSGDDLRIGTEGADKINTGDGNDTIFAGAGNDVVNSGSGNDVVDDGAGSDTVRLGDGNDTLIHVLVQNLNSNDLFYAGSGNDTLKLDLSGINAYFNDQTAAEKYQAAFAWAFQQYLLKGSAQYDLAEGVHQYFVAHGITDLSSAFHIRIQEFEGISFAGVSVNHPPVATPDSITTDEDTPIKIDVLANDSDSDGDTLSISNYTQGAHGLVTLNSDNTFTYSPSTNYNGTDSFTYTIDDGHGGTATTSVSITVTPVNDIPIFTSSATSHVAISNYSYTIPENTTGVVGQVYGYDFDDNDTISFSIVGVSALGPDAVAAASAAAAAADSASKTETGSTSAGSSTSASSSSTSAASSASTATAASKDAASAGTAQTAASVPVDMFLIDNQGNISLNPQYSFDYEIAAQYNVTVKVTDSQGAYSTATVTLNVTDVLEHSPYITSSPAATAVSGQEWSYAPVVTTLDTTTPLTWSLANAPEGMIINPNTGIITWTPGEFDSQSGVVAITVSQTAYPNLSATQYFNIGINHADGSAGSAGSFVLDTETGEYSIVNASAGQDGAPGGAQGRVMIGDSSQPLTPDASHASISAVALGGKGGAGGAGGAGASFPIDNVNVTNDPSQPGYITQVGAGAKGGAGGTGDQASVYMSSTMLSGGEEDTELDLSLTAKGGAGGAGGAGGKGGNFVAADSTLLGPGGVGGDGGAGGQGGNAQVTLIDASLAGGAGNDTINLTLNSQGGAGGAGGVGGEIGEGDNSIPFPGTTSLSQPGTDGTSGQDGNAYVTLTGAVVTGGDGNDVVNANITAQGATALVGATGSNVAGGAGNDTLNLNVTSTSTDTGLAVAPLVGPDHPVGLTDTTFDGGAGDNNFNLNINAQAMQADVYVTNTDFIAGSGKDSLDFNINSQGFGVKGSSSMPTSGDIPGNAGGGAYINLTDTNFNVDPTTHNALPFSSIGPDEVSLQLNAAGAQGQSASQSISAGAGGEAHIEVAQLNVAGNDISLYTIGATGGIGGDGDTFGTINPPGDSGGVAIAKALLDKDSSGSDATTNLAAALYGTNSAESTTATASSTNPITNINPTPSPWPGGGGGGSFHSISGGVGGQAIVDLTDMNITLVGDAQHPTTPLTVDVTATGGVGGSGQGPAQGHDVPGGVGGQADITVSSSDPSHPGIALTGSDTNDTITLNLTAVGGQGGLGSTQGYQGVSNITLNSNIVLQGGEGADTLSANLQAGNIGYSGNQVILNGGAGNDMLKGGTQADTFVFSGSDSVHGQDTDHIQSFNLVNDTIVLDQILPSSVDINDISSLGQYIQVSVDTVANSTTLSIFDGVHTQAVQIIILDQVVIAGDTETDQLANLMGCLDVIPKTE